MSDAGVTPAVSVDAQQLRIADYYRRISACRDDILRLTLAEERIRHETRQFEQEYYAKVGRFYAELDRVELHIKELLYKARLVERGVVGNPEQLDERVENAFRVERRRVERVTTEPPPDAAPSTSLRKRVEDAPSDKKARRLYLKLAKRYHPDKAGDSETRERYDRIMSLINDAYEKRDVATLVRLEMTLPSGSPPPSESPNERERRLYREYLRLHRTVVELRQAVDRLRENETYKMREEVVSAREQGRNPLDELHHSLSDKLNAANARLQTIQAQFQTLMAHVWRRR
jgi:hypothetical protein